MTTHSLNIPARGRAMKIQSEIDQSTLLETDNKNHKIPHSLARLQDDDYSPKPISFKHPLINYTTWQSTLLYSTVCYPLIATYSQTTDCQTMDS